MRYYRLIEDAEIEGRWHLGNVRAGDATGLTLDEGVEFSSERRLCVGLASPGGWPLEFTVTSLGVTIVRDRLKRVMAAIARLDVQWIPAWIDGQRIQPGGTTEHAALNPLRLIQCLDEQLSEGFRWTEGDHRKDLAGNYRQVTRLVLDESRIPDDTHLFRVKEWTAAVIVSEEMKRAMETVGCLGARFQAIAALAR